MRRSCKLGTGLLAIVAVLPLLTSGCSSDESFKEILPGIRLDQHSQLISIDGEVCLETGILEYLAVVENGKEYESVFRLHCKPAHLQQVMLMADWEMGEVASDAQGDFTPGAGTASSQRPAGAPEPAQPPKGHGQKKETQPTYVTIAVEVQTSPGSWERQPIEHYLIDRRLGGQPKQLRWIFTGSYFVRPSPDDPGFFAADQTKSVIALWYDPSCVLNLADNVGNPYRGAAAGLEVNPAVLPPVNTPVRLILRPGSS